VGALAIVLRTAALLRGADALTNFRLIGAQIYERSRILLGAPTKHTVHSPRVAGHRFEGLLQ
jgi:hypothetical protein